MGAYMNPLLDTDFLEQLHQDIRREIFVKIISLDYDENPLEEITGHVTQGSISLDGTSAVQRTCSITMIAEDIDINSYYWGLNTKFKVYIGMKNFINPNYDEIIWFPKGTYLISTFNTAQAVNNFTINIQGKDKMCQLNGDIGGVISALSHDFGMIDEYDEDGNVTHKKYLIKDIITEAVHEYAREPYFNIIVNDLDDVGLELLEYRGNTPMYLIIDESGEVSQFSFNKAQSYSLEPGAGTPSVSIADIELGSVIIDGVERKLSFDQRISLRGAFSSATPTYVYGGSGYNERYSIAKVTYGETVGYRITDITYAGDLIGQVGQSITQAVLDPIVKQLGNFEYFYNDDGQFVFQRKRTYVDHSWNNIKLDLETGKSYVDNIAMTSSSVWSFHDSKLVTSFNNNPNLMNVKNDFSIWGKRKGLGGGEIPIHMRYAIDKKPIFYTTYEGVTYTTLSEEEVEDYKKQLEYEMPERGYQKEASRFGLSEDWWEVRDWAAAWSYSGLAIPTKNLGAYCPVKAKMTTDIAQAGVPLGTSLEFSYVPQEEVDKWATTLGDYVTTDDLVFREDGTLWDYHGGCMHSYTWWLTQFEKGGQYEGGYAYFYKPQVPADDIASGNTGMGLQLGDKIYYSQEWRELIYQMALDALLYQHTDDFFAVIANNNKNFYPTGMTGYEQYYVDMNSFWRDLYDPSLDELNIYEFIKWIPSRVEADGKTHTYKQTDPEAEEIFNDSRRLLYKKRDNKYVGVNIDTNVEPYVPTRAYYTKGDDLCEKHIASTFYQVNADGDGYNEFKEPDIVTIRKIATSADLTTDYYYPNAGSYDLYTPLIQPTRTLTIGTQDYGGSKRSWQQL